MDSDVRTQIDSEGKGVLAPCQDGNCTLQNEVRELNSKVESLSGQMRDLQENILKLPTMFIEAQRAEGDNAVKIWTNIADVAKTAITRPALLIVFLLVIAGIFGITMEWPALGIPLPGIAP
jgi:hypothetical protein